MNKRKCVLGVLKSEEGLKIKEEMLEWLSPLYDVELVEVDPPNDKLFEYPFIKRACEKSLETNEPILYLHTKGAGNPNNAQSVVRNFWMHEFVENSDIYFDYVNENVAKASAPIVGIDNSICWFNGFVINTKAADAILKVLTPHEDRYWFEGKMLKEANVKVYGRLELHAEEHNFAWDSFCHLYRTLYGIKAVISLTSWKKRIDTVYKTIQSIIDHCPGFHICLTLSVEEFPNREKDLPESLMNLSDKFEFIWIKQNPKAFKKVLFALNKYKNVPVISADDDCIYNENYAQILYDKWLTDKTAMWTYDRNTDVKAFYFGHGPACLYPPYCFKEYGLRMLTKEIVDTNHDDIYYGVLAKFMCIKVKQALDDNKHVPYVFHDETEPLHDSEMDGCKCINICVNSMMQCITRVPEEVLIA